MVKIKKTKKGGDKHGDAAAAAAASTTEAGNTVLAQAFKGKAKDAKKLQQRLDGPSESQLLNTYNKQNQQEKISGQRVVVVLEKCFLELVQIHKGQYELLNSEDHKTIMLKHDRQADLEDARPDITHQCLMALLDSPLNRTGKLSIFVHTHKNVLIEINPATRIPRTFKRFCGLMIELLQRNKIRAAQTNEVLMKVISNPVEKYLPPGGRKVGMSVAGKSVNIRDFAAELAESSSKLAKKNAGSDGKEMPITFVIGGVAHSDPVQQLDFGGNYVEEKISISPYGLSAACVCAKVCHEFEHLWVEGNEKDLGKVV